MKKLLFIFFLFLLASQPAFAQDMEITAEAENIEPKTISESHYEKAEILAIHQVQLEDESVLQELKVKILSGEFKNQTVSLTNTIENNPYAMDLEQGDKIVLYVEQMSDGTINHYVHDYYRLGKIIVIILIFFALLIIFGGFQGLKTVISLLLGILFILKFLLPGILKGTSPIFLTIIFCSVITVITFLLISGWNKKAASSILGTIFGLIVSVILALIFGKMTILTGFGHEETRTLFAKFPNLNFNGLFYSAIMIGAIGAVMDVAMSISSSINEIKKANPKLNSKELFKSGVRIGKDIIGTMSNTLIYAYVGASLGLLLLFSSFGESYLKIFNFEFMAEEIIRSIAGSIGLIGAIPLTAMFAAWFETRSKKSKQLKFK